MFARYCTISLTNVLCPLKLPRSESEQMALLFFGKERYGGNGYRVHIAGGILMRRQTVWAVTALAIFFLLVPAVLVRAQGQNDLDNQLAAVLQSAGFSGMTESTLETRL